MAKKTVHITGIETVMKNLNKEALKISGKTMGGLIRGGILVKNSMMKDPPTVPLEFGNLRSSYFTQPFPSKNAPVLLMGFTANYATIVHERVEGAPWGTGVVGDVKWRDPGSGPKFLESALKRKETEILQEMKNSVKY